MIKFYLYYCSTNPQELHQSDFPRIESTLIFLKNSQLNHLRYKYYLCLIFLP
jgi:hypothetical protein